MADDAMFKGPITEKGPPKWMLIGGAIAAVAGIAVLVSRNTSNGGATTSAGASINAGLGSIQEEQMNLLGTVQAGALANAANFKSTSGQISDTQTNIIEAIQNQGTATQSQIQGAINTINANTNSNNQGLMAAVTDALNQLMGSQKNILSVVNSQSQTMSTMSAQMASNAAQEQTAIIRELQDLQTLLNAANTQGASLNTIQSWTNEIRSRLAQGDYNNPFVGPDFSPWTASGGGGSGGGLVGHYTINLAGGGQMTVNANSQSAAIENVKAEGGTPA